jgi:hypothetical protein
MKRRTALRLMGAAVAVSGAPMILRPAAAAPLKLDPKNPEHVRLIYRKLAYAADDKVYFWWMRGTRLGLVNSAFTPFWDMHIGQIFTVRDLGPDSFEVSSISGNFYTDVETGRFLETFKNPLTGKEVKVNYAPPRVGKRVYTKDGLKNDFQRPGVTLTRTGNVGPAWIEGQDIWVRGDTSLRGEPNAPGAKLFQVNDWSTYFGALKDVADPDVKSAPAGQAFNDVNTWPDWLEMGNQPGNFVSRCFGRKVTRYEDMPEVWRKIMAERAPAVAKDPAGALKG